MSTTEFLELASVCTAAGLHDHDNIICFAAVARCRNESKLVQSASDNMPPSPSSSHLAESECLGDTDKDREDMWRSLYNIDPSSGVHLEGFQVEFFT